MRDRAVLDSGVIFALYFEEDASLRAVKAANEYSPLTLDLAVAEVGNAAWKRVAFFKESKDATWLSLSKCMQFIKPAFRTFSPSCNNFRILDPIALEW